MQYNTELERYIHEIKQYGLFSSAEQYEYLKRYKNGETDLIDLIFKKNTLLVVKKIKKYYSYIKSTNLELMDLIQYGNLALLNAIKTYDFSFNTTFSTWASFLIEREIYKSIRKDGYSMTYYEKSYNRMIKYDKIIEEFIKTNGREPSIKEIASKLCVSEQKVMEIRDYKTRISLVSLNMSTNDNNASQLIELIEDKNANEIDDFIEDLNKKNINEFILNILKNIRLTDKEYFVIVNRYGLLDGRIKTQVEIAKELNCRKQYIFNLEKNAIRKIIKSKYIFELALFTDKPIDNLENLGYEKNKIKDIFSNLNKI